LDLKALANEFDISTTRVSKIQREIKRMDKADLKLQQLLRQYKVKQRPHLCCSHLKTPSTMNI